MTAWDKYSIAMRKMGDYHAKHGTGLNDFETYSKDPEWQHLNKELNDSMMEYARERKAELEHNRYYPFNDGAFSYYINVDTREKKFELEEGDVEVESPFDPDIDCGLM